MQARGSTRETELSVRQNASFFLRRLDAYESSLGALDTYGFIRAAVNESIVGSQSLLDIGNGGVFDYDGTLARRTLAVDLFLEDIPDTRRYPVNVTLKKETR